MSRILVNELGARTGTDISIKSGSTLGGADSQLKITGGSSGQVLTTNGLGVLTWTTIGVLPTQSGQSGKFLTTDGTDTSWSTITHPTELPAQTSQSGKYLTTNGTIVSWATVDALPSQTGQAGEFLQTDGTTATWESVDALPTQTGQAGEFLQTDGTTATWEAVDALPTQTGQAGEFLQTDGTTATWEPAGGGYDVATTSTGYFDVPTGTTAQRPGSPATGNLRVNSDLNQLEHYIDGIWVGFAGSVPTITGVSPTTSIISGTTITISGINFQSGSTVQLIGTDNSIYTPSAVTFVNSGQIDFVTPELPVEFEPFDVKVTLPSGGVAIQPNVLDAGGVPVWTTVAGSLGTVNDNATGTHFTLVATDPDSQVVTFSMETAHQNTLTTAGLTLNGTTGAITGDPTDASVGGSTLYNFDVKATDSTGVNTTIRSFSITVNGILNGASGGTITNYSSGGINYRVHAFTTAGITQTFNPGTYPGSCDILAIAGGGGGGRVMSDQDTAQGGGGAGCVGVTTGFALSTGNYTFDIGRGAYYAEAGRIWKQWPANTNENRVGLSGEDTVLTDPTSTIMITLPGGGGGGRSDGSGGTPPAGNNGVDGGSGGGGGSRATPSNGGSSTTPTVSGWTTYGNFGGGGNTGGGGGGGGGGAGAPGGPASGSTGGSGGDGIQNNFLNGTQIYYGGGGGAGSTTGNSSQSPGGAGGGGKGINCINASPTPATNADTPATENTGGGGGGTADPNSSASLEAHWAGGGGSGIVLIRYVVS